MIFSLWAMPVFASPVLIQLHLKGQADFQKASDLNLSVYHRFNNIIIAEFEKTRLNALQGAGLSFRIIDEEPWTESYYVISKGKRPEQVDLSRYGRILVQTGDIYFLKISDETARTLAEKGYHIAKVFRHTIPLIPKPAVGKPSKSYPYYDPGIDSLVSLVSSDSLYVWDLQLQNFGTRYSYSDALPSVRQWLFDKLKSFGIDSVWYHHYYWDSDQYNVVATVKGTAHPHIVLVVGGHYDSVVYGPGADPYSWAPGADDNGSGTVATLEIARIVAQHPLPVTVIFVPFAQEEQGLIGSYFFAEYLRNHQVDMQLMLNADMIGHSVDADTDVTIYADSGSLEFVNLMSSMADQYTYLHPHYKGQSSGSDHYSFYQWRYDAIYAEEGDFFNSGWHRNYDLVDSLDFDYMKEVVKMEFATLISHAKTVGSQFVIGDVNSDDGITLLDIIYLINYLFKGGPAPVFFAAADANCDHKVSIADAVFLINYFFKDGGPPACN